MPVTRFSLSDLLDLSGLRRETLLYLARDADFLLHPLLPGHSDPQPPAPACSGRPGWPALLSGRWLDGVQAMRRIP